MKNLKELLKLFSTFFKIGILTIGGGYAMLPMIEREVVIKNKWATMEEVMDYFAISQCTPGVIAVNTATFIGHKTKGITGAIVATIGVITPSVIIISLIATFLQTVYENKFVKYALQGVGVAVCAILVQAVVKIGKAGIIDKFTCIVAAAGFFAALLFDASTIVVIIVAGAAGIIYKLLAEKRSKKDGGAE